MAKNKKKNKNKVRRTFQFINPHTQYQIQTHFLQIKNQDIKSIFSNLQLYTATKLITNQIRISS